MSPSATVLLSRLLARGKFRHVQVLLRLTELGSVQRTASAIGLTQSSVTQTLAYLERLLQLQLFERHARGVRPTPACRQMLPAMRQLMVGLEQGADLASGSHLRGQQQVRVLASASATNGMLLPTLGAFHDRHPQVRLLLGEVEGEDQLLAIARDAVDLVACRQPTILPEGWVFEPLVEDELVVACGPRHALARRRHLRWADFAGETWLPGPAGSIARRRLDELLERFERAPPLFPLVTRVPTLIAAALRERSVLAFLPRNYLRHLVDAGELVVLALDERFPIEPLGLLVPATGRSDAVERLRAHLRSVVDASAAAG